MKENKYDNDRFFKAYSSFPRSVEGLQAAGEWHALKALLPDFSGKHVLDIGCGFGWHCVYAAQQGAAQVLGIDISEKMLAVARAKTTCPNVTYRRIAMEDLEPGPHAFHVVISSLAFHYTADFAGLCRRIHGGLRPGGDFVFSVEHPIFTAQGPQDWIYDDAGEPSCWPVDSYFAQGRRDTVFLGEPVIKYHRTLAEYINTLLQSGFDIREVVEPTPTQALLSAVPDMRHELRRPMMLLIAAKKRG